MKKNWFFIDQNGVINGPVSFNDLKSKLNKDTLVWTEGFDDWKKAKDLPEFETLFISPPPVPNELIKKTQYDSFYKENKENSETKNEKNIKPSEFSYALYKTFILILVNVYMSFIKEDSLYYLSIGKKILYIIVITTSIYSVYTALKKYLNKLDNFYKVNTYINLMILIEITSNLLYLFIIKDLYNKHYILIFIIGLIYLYVFIVFNLRLLLIKNDYSNLIKLYSITNLVSLIILIPTYIWVQEERNISIISSILTTLPLLILALLFYVTKEQLKSTENQQTT